MRRVLRFQFLAVSVVTVGALLLLMFLPGLGKVGDQLDANHDGKLTPDELPPLVRRDFGQVDIDGNGHVGPAELRIRLLRQALFPDSRRPAVAFNGEATFPTLAAYVDATVEHAGLNGAVLMLGFEGQIVFSHSTGDLDPETVIPLASASKWLTGAVIATVAESTGHSLTTPIAPHVHGMALPDDAMTLAQMLSHTAGTTARGHFDLAPTLAAEVERYTNQPLQARPGTEFRYGGASMLMAARAAELMTGKDWRELARQNLFAPLGMTSTVYANPVRPLPHGMDTAPDVAGGVHGSAADYMRFLAMLANDGKAANGARVIGENMLAQMSQARTVGLTRGFVPPAVTDAFEYGFGFWCERWTERNECTLMHSQGAFGTRPFLDTETGIYGIFLILDNGERQRDVIQAMRETALRVARSELLP